MISSSYRSFFAALETLLLLDVYPPSSVREVVHSRPSVRLRTAFAWQIEIAMQNQYVKFFSKNAIFFRSLYRSFRIFRLTFCFIREKLT